MNELSHSTQNTEEQISGVIERITFFNPENGYSIIKIKVKNNSDRVTIVGELGALSEGEYVHCRGQWVNDRKYGKQLKVSAIEVILPDTLAGIERYLGSGLLRGIGAHFAKKMVAKFGTRVFDIIEHSPKELLKIPQFGKQRLQMVMDSWEDQKMAREAILFLQDHGVGLAKAMRVYKSYGASTVAKIKTNPYALAFDIDGIGFKTADDLALKLGFAPHSVERAIAGIDHVLKTLCQEGHCTYPRAALLTATAELLSLNDDILTQALEQGIIDGHWVAELVDEVACVYPRALYWAEAGVAREIARLQEGECPWQGNIDKNSVSWLDKQIHIRLSDSQAEALLAVLQHKLSIITGGPGVGKTTLVNSLLKLFHKARLTVNLCAPTGRAAKRMMETTGFPAQTIHRLLEIDPIVRAAKFNQEEPLQADVFIIDESSMIDITLMYQLLKAIPTAAAVIWVGDSDQLPSVGPGAVLSDFIASETIATVHLTEIFRQVAHSQIILNAHRINQGVLPVAHGLKEADFYVIAEQSPEAIFETVINLVVERLPRYHQCSAIQDIQVLSPMNRGTLGTLTLNNELQKRLNGEARVKINRLGTIYAVGDKVIQSVNDYEKAVFNGDIGWIENIDMEAQTVQILFDGRSVQYDVNELDQINLAYAISIHKSQGCEFPIVVIPLAMQHYNLLVRNLLYTGITRGKKMVVLVVEQKALQKAVANDKTKARITKLKERLQRKVVLK
jgi:exodeoxyribonuclease V alpha subunit